MTLKEKLWYAAAGTAGGAVLSFLFFRSLWAFGILGPLGALYPALARRKIERRRREKLLIQWKEAMTAFGIAMSAGYSAENAVRQTWMDMKQRYGEEQMISRELEMMVYQIGINVPAEKALDDFAARSGLDEVRSFAEVFRVGKRSGADLIRITSEAAEMIGARVEVKEEMITMMTGVRLEGRMMNLVPLAILAYMNGTSPQFFSPMYETLFGRIVMAAGMACYLAICFYGQRLMEIEL